MPSNPPVNFEELVKGPTGTTGKDYPYAIKARDLMQDFVFATLDIAEGVYTETTGAGGHSQRRLNIDAGTEANQIYIWDGSKITVIATPTEGSVLAFTSGAFNYIPAPSSGTYVLGSTGGALSWGTGTGGNTREYIVAINGTLYKEGFQCATQDAAGEQYPIEIP